MKKIAIITTKWNPEFVWPCVEGIVETFHLAGLEENATTIFQVPGGVEIPLFAKKLAETGTYDAIIAVAFICENPIYKYEFVASSVVSHIIAVSCEVEVPILSSVLSPVKFNRADPKDVSFYSEHMKLKWQEAATSCLEIIEVHKSI